MIDEIIIWHISLIDIVSGSIRTYLLRLCYNTSIMNPHLLQSHDWEKYSKLEGHPTFWLENDKFQALAVAHNTPLGKYLFCPYGPTLAETNSLEALKSALAVLRTLAEEQDAFFVRIEPTVDFSTDDLKKLGLVKSHDQEPAHTWVLDLSLPESELLDGIEKTKVRHWRNAAKKGISVRTTKDPAEISILTKFLQNVGKRDNFTPQDEKHLQNQLQSGFATLYIAEFEGNPIAASLVYDYAGVRYYAHAATDDEHRKLMAGTILLVQMILDAKNADANTFDFWGITTSTDPQHPWYGFTQYKKSFGGKQINYSGTWDLPVKPVKYHLYQIIRQANRLKRKIIH